MLSLFLGYLEACDNEDQIAARDEEGNLRLRPELIEQLVLEMRIIAVSITSDLDSIIESSSTPPRSL